MDTLTHALSGALLARALAARPAAADPSATTRPPLWQLVLAGALAGAFPDIDGFTQLLGDRIYLTQHRGYTHALPLLPLWAWLLAQAAAALVRLRSGAGGVGRGGARGSAWFAVMAGGIGLHIAGDWITGFGTMAWLPFSDARLSLGAVFIIDLGLSGLLLAGLALAAALPTRRWPALLGLAAAVGWVVLAWTGQREAIAVGERVVQAQGLSGARVSAIARPASPFNWTVVVDDGRSYQIAQVNTRRSAPLQAGPDDFFLRRLSSHYRPESMALWQRLPRFGPSGTPGWVMQAWQAPEFAFFRWFSELPVLIGAQQGRDAQGRPERCAAFRDLRFEFPGRPQGPFRYAVCLGDDPQAPARVWRLEEDGERRPV